MLIFEPDPESQDMLRGVASGLGCEHIKADSPQGLRHVLSVRRPTIAVPAVDRRDPDGFSVLDAVVEQGARPATLLVGGISSRLLSSTRRTAESRGLPVLCVATRPLDALTVEHALTPYLSSSPPISAREMEQALLESELYIQYLPKLSINSATPKIIGVEALVRWQHPRRGLLQPGRFLDSFDDNGLMLRLTDIVMTEAVRQAGQWRSKGLSLQMVVNLSPRLVHDAAFPERLALLLRENNFPPQQLILDVTQSPTTAGRDMLLDVFTRLRILGVGLALDNFGTGVSSLTEIYRMPFSEIKVDHSLLADVPRESAARVIVKAITDLAKTLQLSVCAEGIETFQMLEFARSSGFDTAQGRFFGEAVDAADVEDLVRAWPAAGPAASDSWRTMRPLDFDANATCRIRLASLVKSKRAK